MLGVPESTFNHLLKYIKEHQSEFRTFTPEEALTLLLVQMKTGLSFSFLEGFVNMKRDQRVNVDTISLSIKKCLYILVGSNKYQKTFADDMEITREKAEKMLYHNKKAFNRIKNNLPGKFFQNNVGWKTVGGDINRLLREGSSCFHKCMEKDFYELKDLIDHDDTGKENLVSFSI